MRCEARAQKILCIAESAYGVGEGNVMEEKIGKKIFVLFLYALGALFLTYAGYTWHAL